MTVMLSADGWPTDHLPRAHSMTRRIFQSLITIPATCLTIATAAAQDTAPPRSEFYADLGFVSVSGNTSVTTLSLGEKWIRRLARWEFRQEVGAMYGETDGAETSNLWCASPARPRGWRRLSHQLGVDDRCSAVASRGDEGIIPDPVRQPSLVQCGRNDSAKQV